MKIETGNVTQYYHVEDVEALRNASATEVWRAMREENVFDEEEFGEKVGERLKVFQVGEGGGVGEVCSMGFLEV